MKKDLENWMSAIREYVVTSKKALTFDQIESYTKKLKDENVLSKHFNCSFHQINDIPGLKTFGTRRKIYVKCVSSDDNETTAKKAKPSANHKTVVQNKNNTSKDNPSQANVEVKEENRSPTRTTRAQTKSTQPMSVPANASSQQIVQSAHPVKSTTVSSNRNRVENNQTQAKKQSTFTMPMQSHFLQPYVSLSTSNFAIAPSNSSNTSNKHESLPNNYWQRVPQSWLNKLKEFVKLTVFNQEQQMDSFQALLEDPCRQLIAYTALEHLPPPYYEIVSTGRRCFYADVLIGRRVFKSYPRTAYTTKYAQKLAAIAAVKQISYEVSVYANSVRNNRITNKPY